MSFGNGRSKRRPKAGTTLNDFATGITPPSASVSSAATSRTVSPSAGRRSLVMRLVMPETEMAAKGSLQSSSVI